MIASTFALFQHLAWVKMQTAFTGVHIPVHTDSLSFLTHSGWKLLTHGARCITIGHPDHMPFPALNYSPPNPRRRAPEEITARSNSFPLCTNAEHPFIVVAIHQSQIQQQIPINLTRAEKWLLAASGLETWLFIDQTWGPNPSPRGHIASFPLASHKRRTFVVKSCKTAFNSCNQ